MNTEKSIQQTLKSLLKKADILCKLDGTYDALGAKSKEDIETSLNKKIMVSSKSGIRGKVAAIVSESLTKQLSSLSVDEINQLASVLSSTTQETSSINKLTVLNHITINLANTIIDKVVAGDHELLENLDSALFNSVHNLVKENQPEEIMKIVGWQLEEGSHNPEPIYQTVFSSETKYIKALEQMEKFIDNQDNKNI